MTDLAQLVLSWRPRQPALTATVYCQTTVSGDIAEACTQLAENTLRRPHETGQQARRRRRRNGLTISEQLQQLRESSTVCSTDDDAVCSSSHHNTPTNNIVVRGMDGEIRTVTAAGVDAVCSSSPGISRLEPCIESGVASSLQLGSFSSVEDAVHHSIATAPQSLPVSVSGAAVCQPAIMNSSDSPSVAVCDGLTSALESNPRTASISPVGVHTSNGSDRVITSASGVCWPRNNIGGSPSVTEPGGLASHLPATESRLHPAQVGDNTTSIRPNIVTTSVPSTQPAAAAAAVGSGPTLLWLPSSTQHFPAVASAAADRLHRVTERAASGPVLVDMDIGSGVLGAGLVYGTFVYHGGHLLLGQQRPGTSCTAAVGPHDAPIYFLAGSTSVVAPSTNIYAVAVPNDALLGGLRVVCDGAVNVVGDSLASANVSAVQPRSATVAEDSSTATVSGTLAHDIPVADDSNSATVDGTLACDIPATSSTGTLDNSGRPNAEPSSAGEDWTEILPSVTAADSDGGLLGGKASHSLSVTATATSSTTDSHQGSRFAAEPRELADETAEIVPCSATVPAVSVAGGSVASSVIQEPSEVSCSSRCSPLMDSDAATDTQFAVSAGHVASQSSGAVHRFTASSSFSLASSALPSATNETASGEYTAKQPPERQQQGLKRRLVSQSADECTPKTKTGRIDSEKRISRYICPPPDSDSDRDGEIIRVMDRLCDKSLEQYSCPAYSSVSYCSAISEQLATASHPSSAEDNVSMLLAISARDYNLTGRSSTGTSVSSGIPSAVQSANLNHELMTSVSQRSACVNTEDICASQSEISHVHLHDSSSGVDSLASGHGKGFVLANFLSATATPSMLISSSSQQSSLLDASQTSKNAQNSSSVVDHVATQNHNFAAVSKISSSALACDSSILPDDLSLTDNDFAMIFSDTDDGSTISLPSKKTADNSSYWSLGFPVCSRLRDRAKDVPSIDPLHASAEDFFHSLVPVFREQNYIPETDYVMSDHVDLGSRVCFNVSSLTCKTTSVSNTSLSAQTANSFLNNTSSTLCQTSADIPHSYPFLSQHAAASADQANSHSKLHATSAAHVSDVVCSTVQSSGRGGIFSLAHHAIQPASKSFIPNPSSSSSEVAQCSSVLWSPCSGTARKSNLSSSAWLSAEHRQTLNIGRQCRLPSSTIADVHWRMPEPASFAPLYNSWSDNNLYCNVQPLARPRPFVDHDQIVGLNAQPATHNMQSVFSRPKLHSVSETDHDKTRRRWSDDDDFSPFVSSKNKPATRKQVHPNCQYSSHHKPTESGKSQPLWTYSECNIAPQSYLSSSSGWLPATDADTGPAMIDLPLSIPATSTCRLPPFSFATVPPVPDFLSLSLASTTAGANTAAAAEVCTWPPATPAVSTSASRGWTPIFPQNAALQSRHIVSATSSLTSVSVTHSRPDVTYTVPSFVHADQQLQKQPPPLNTHLPSYPLWQHGTEYNPVEMCNLPPVSVVNSDTQLLPIHGRGLYSNGETGSFIANTLTSPPLHHHPLYSSQQAGLYGTVDKHVSFETPFPLTRLPLTSQVLKFSAPFETIPSPARAQLHCEPTFNVGNVPVHIRRSEDPHQSQPAARQASSKRPSKCSRKQLKHNASSLCVGCPASQTGGTVSQPVAGDVPTYLPADPFVGQKPPHPSEYQVGVSFGAVFGSCSLRQRLVDDVPKSSGVAGTADANERHHNFDIGAFISDLPSSSVQAVTAPAAIRRLDFPVPPPPPVDVLRQPDQCQRHATEYTQPSSHNLALHSMSINSLLGDNPYPAFTHRYEAAYSDTANHSTSLLRTYDVPTLNFSIRSQTSSVNFDHAQNTKVRHT